MYYVGEISIGFDRDTCFFNTLDEAMNDLGSIFNELVSDVSRRATLLREYGVKADGERWVVKDTTTNKIIATMDFIVYSDGTFKFKKY